MCRGPGHSGSQNEVNARADPARQGKPAEGREDADRADQTELDPRLRESSASNLKDPTLNLSPAPNPLPNLNLHPNLNPFCRHEKKTQE